MWLRSASLQDLDMINAVIEHAVMTWDLPARVKRLSLPTYLYNVADLATMDIVVAGVDETIAGTAAWEAAAARENSPKQTFLLLHGIFVDPGRQGRGVGLRVVLLKTLHYGYGKFSQSLKMVRAKGAQMSRNAMAVVFACTRNLSVG